MADAFSIARARMLALPAFLALVDKNQIYPIALPQSASPPCVSMTLVGGMRETTLAGQGKQNMQRLSIEATALTAQQVIDIGNVLLELLPCVKLDIAGARLVDIVFADTDFADNSDDLSTFRRGLHFRVHWQH